MSNDKTVIQVLKSTRDKLNNIGKKGESFDDIINLLINQFSLKGSLAEDPTTTGSRA